MELNLRGSFSLLVTSLLLFVSTNLTAQLFVPNWPDVLPQYLDFSIYFEVAIQQDGGPWENVPVLMSQSQDELIVSGDIYQNRTFNVAPFSFDPSSGPVTVRVTKRNIAGKVGSNARNVEVYNYSGEKTRLNDSTITFKLSESRYVPVIFAMEANKNISSVSWQQTPSGNPLFMWKHMLTIFADEPDIDLIEPAAPAGLSKLVYSDSASEADIRNADILVFRRGVHDINTRWGLRGLRVTDGTVVWIAPDAILSGNIRGVDAAGLITSVSNVYIFGKGMIYAGSMRNDPVDACDGPYWKPPFCGLRNDTLPDVIELQTNGSSANGNIVSGPMVADSHFHGIVPGSNSLIKNVKLWGWHFNCDGFRPSSGRVEHCFIRAVDDALYTFAVEVEDVVFWHSGNGAIATAGWGYGSAYHSGGFSMKNCIQVYPEWVSRWNNNGVLMSQQNLDQGSDGITIENFRSFGGSPVFLNLKPLDNILAHRRPRPGNGLQNVTLDKVTFAGTPAMPEIEFQEPSLISSFPAPGEPNFDPQFPFHKLQILDAELAAPNGAMLTEINLSNRAFFLVPPEFDDSELSATASESQFFYLSNEGADFFNLGGLAGGSFTLDIAEAEAQMWQKRYLDEEYFYLENRALNGLRLKAVDDSTFDLTTDFGWRVQWRKAPGPEGYFYLENRAHPNRYLHFDFSLGGSGIGLTNTPDSTAYWLDDYNLRTGLPSIRPEGSSAPISSISLECFPNPTNTVLNIQLTGFDGEMRFRVFNMQGNLIHAGQTNGPNMILPVDELASGFYTIEVIAGSKYYATKFFRSK